MGGFVNIMRRFGNTEHLISTHQQQIFNLCKPLMFGVTEPTGLQLKKFVIYSSNNAQHPRLCLWLRAFYNKHS